METTDNVRITMMIRNKLKEKNMSRTSFCAHIGRSAQWLRDIESGLYMPQYDDQIKIESLLKIPIWNL